MLYADDRRIGDHGIGRFARNVLAALEFRPISLQSDPDSPLDPWLLARALAKLTRKDVFFSPGYNPPLYCVAPFVITLHDLNHIDRDENSSRLKRLYYSTVVKRACHLSAHILTVSEFSRRRILEWSGVPPEKVVNVGCGVGEDFRTDAAPYPLPFPYLLCVSNRRGHKNEARQVEAFSKSGLASQMRMVFTGDPTAELADCIERNGVTQSVHFVGLVPDCELPALYHSAVALVFASLYEGFGLPVLEAMACGTPVITSNTSALPEIAGDAALLVDPTSVEQISQAMAQAVTDSSLRQQMRIKGLARAAQFSWSNTGGKVQRLLLSVSAQESGVSSR